MASTLSIHEETLPDCHLNTYAGPSPIDRKFPVQSARPVRVLELRGLQH